MEWTEAGKVSGSLVLGEQAPVGLEADAWEADAEDGCRLEVFRVGTGSASDPHVVHVRCHSPEGPEGRARFPTLEEMQGAVNHVTLQGSIMSMGVVQSAGRDADMVPSVGWSGMMAMQIGGAEGSPASARLKLTGGISLVGPNAPGAPGRRPAPIGHGGRNGHG